MNLLTPAELTEIRTIAENFRGKFVSSAPRVQRVFQLLDKLIHSAEKGLKLAPECVVVGDQEVR